MERPALRDALSGCSQSRPARLAVSAERCQRQRRRQPRLLALVFGLVGCSPLPTLAQASGYHWAYASYFGTGRYDLDGRSETVVLGFSPAWTWREPALSSEGQRRIGYRFRLPISVGAAEFASVDQLDDFRLASISAIGAVPGVEIEIPVTDRWRLKPLAYLGLGHETDGGVSARIFRIGMRSRLDFDLGKTGMQLVNGFERIGYSTSQNGSDALNLLNAGLDFSRPLAMRKLGGVPVELNWHLRYTRYLDTLGLDLPELSLKPAAVNSEWELGIGFSKQSGRLRWWRLKLDRLGIALHGGADGKFSGVGIVFKSLFDR